MNNAAPYQYKYDKIGNLVQNTTDGIADIEWNIYGKVEKVTKTPDPFGIQATVEYRYDGTGNRIMKKITAGATSTTTTYLRDASGNVMAIYEEKTDQTLAIKEIPIYGGSRLGQYRPKTDTKKTALGQRIYEFSNHLGNVLVTLTDNKVPQTDGTYKAIVLSASDYYPFGLAMAERTYSNGNYRYGFNGKENDTDFGSHIQDYGFRLYSRESARFLSVDPLSDSYPFYTPYQFAGNNPVRFTDLDGLEENDPYPEAYLNQGTRINMANAPDGSFKTASGRWSKTKTVEGRKWNAAWYWDQVRQRHPEMFSSDNVERIDKGKSPRADDQWITHNPQHSKWRNMRLEHHHLDHGHQAYALPWKLHRGSGYTKLWHRFGRAARNIGLLGSFFAFATTVYGNTIEDAVKSLDPLGLAIVTDDLVESVDEVHTKVALSQDFSKSSKFFENSGDFAVFYAEDADVFDLIQGTLPNLKENSDRFRSTGLITNAEQASEEFGRVISNVIIYKKNDKGEYAPIAVRELSTE